MRYIFPITKYRVVDGDTLHCQVDMGFNISKSVNVRLSGINTPEVRLTKEGGPLEKSAGKVVSEIAKRWLESCSTLYLESTSVDKYGRVLGIVYNSYEAATSDSTSLNKYLINSNCAVSYNGGKKELFQEDFLRSIVSAYGE